MDRVRKGGRRRGQAMEQSELPVGARAAASELRLRSFQIGGVPLCFHVDNGNTTDDTTHRRSWDLLAQLAGKADFLYVADCKLASRENLHQIGRASCRERVYSSV